ncbi:MAG: methyltransferase domain-containing protein [bacterium]|nr:methyltransferase domain-containing protein [bacterium]
MITLFALTTRGLEAVTAGEMAALHGIRVTETTYRRVAATCEDNPAPLLMLRTPDDVFLQAAIWDGIARPRETLARLNTFAAELDLYGLAQVCASLRLIYSPVRFSISASFVGKHNYTADEIKAACADSIAEAHGWVYTDDDSEADLNVRIFIDHETAYVGLRLGKKPLQDRAYKQANLPGSTKPPVAAAMLQLAEVRPKMRLLDPCCGAGTILIEGALLGAQPWGGDSDPAAVAASRQNMRSAGLNVRVERWDAGDIPVETASVDRIVSNLPWGLQVETDEMLADFYARACAEMERVLRPGGRIALLTNAPHLLRFETLQAAETVEISLFGQTPTIALYKG